MFTSLWWDFAEGEPISLEVKEYFLTSGYSMYTSYYSRNSYLYSIFPSGHFRVFNILLIGVDEKGHKLLC